MKKLLILACALCGGMPLAAQTAESAAPQQVAVAEPGAVGKAIEQISFITEHKPNPHAKYYMYLHSAYWCGPCRHEMPGIVAEYPNMIKDNRMEVILIGHDHTVKGALRYLELYSAPFAAVMYRSKERKLLPGCEEDVFGIPTIIVVDARGQLIYHGHACMFIHWDKFASGVQ